MSALPAEILKGLLAEAQGYVKTARQVLVRLMENGASPELLVELQRQIKILDGGAQMLDLKVVTGLVMPATHMLGTHIDSNADLSDEECSMLLTMLNEIETHLVTLGADAAKGVQPNVRSVVPGLPDDLPAELAEIFALEANEHCQSIQVGLERLRRSPDDLDSLKEVRRVTHTLKGAAASVGFNVMARLAHLMEDLAEHRLDAHHVLSNEEIELLLDTSDLLQGLIDPDPLTDLALLAESIDRRYEEVLAGVYPALEPRRPSEVEPARSDGEETDALPVQRLENPLRVPRATLDNLINRVGEIVVNRAAMEGHLGGLHSVLAELTYSTRRLRRVALNIDTEIQAASQRGTGGIGSLDQLFDPLELERYSLLYQLVRELEEAATDTGDVDKQLHVLTDELSGALTQARRLTTDLQDGLMATRLVSFRELETRLRRTLHRTANDLGKAVDQQLIGFDTKVDKVILDALADPLMHLLRNAIDHGIEMPEVRKASGKPPEGVVTIAIGRERGRVVIRLSDDGAGVDLGSVKRRAEELGILAQGDQPDKHQLLDFLYHEGFSLARSVTHTSGRGVGLNIVRRAVSQLQGTIRIETQAGYGTTFVISVPITLAITRALFVQSAGQTFAVPLEQFEAVLRLEPEVLPEIELQGLLRHDGRAFAVYNLATFVNGLDTKVATERYGLLTEARGRSTAVLIDSLAGTHEAVVKSLGTHLRHVPGIAGATITGDGCVVLILDLDEVVGGSRSASEITRSQLPMTASRADALHVLVVDDSLSVRRVVSSFLERAGWRVTAAKDGIEALEEIAVMRPDVALVDIEMPRMNGFELLSTMKSDPNLQNIPVVFLTSRSAAKHRERAAQLRVDGYIVKPYREDEMLKTLARAVDSLRQTVP